MTTAIVPWFLESDEINMLASVSLIARFMIGKFKTSEHNHNATVRRINAAVAQVPINQSDTKLTCRTWLMRVLDVMMKEGLVELSVPDVASFERRVVAEADEVMRKIMVREIEIDKKSAIPLFDMRATQD